MARWWGRSFLLPFLSFPSSIASVATLNVCAGLRSVNLIRNWNVWVHQYSFFKNKLGYVNMCIKSFNTRVLKVLIPLSIFDNKIIIVNY